MAKKEEAPKKVLERTYNIPLRKEFRKVAKWRRAEKAVTALRKFIVKHMKSDNVIINRYVNQLLWKNGIKNPPHHVKVNASKDEKGKVSVELVELSAKAKRELKKEDDLRKRAEGKEVKKEEAKKAEDAAKKPEAKKEEKAPETKEGQPETKESQVKKEEKTELKELKKELPKQAPQPMAAAKQVQQQATAPKGQ
jgi:large subunit ribosomal protein L31e|tara:strand:- start:76 stop:660 length:585 start_codon:yes stop_codon:yes gene_type:complete